MVWKQIQGMNQLLSMQHFIPKQKHLFLQFGQSGMCFETSVFLSSRGIVEVQHPVPVCDTETGKSVFAACRQLKQATRSDFLSHVLFAVEWTDLGLPQKRIASVMTHVCVWSSPSLLRPCVIGFPFVLHRNHLEFTDSALKLPLCFTSRFL